MSLYALVGQSIQFWSGLAYLLSIFPEIPAVVKINIYGHFWKVWKFRKFLYGSEADAALWALPSLKELSAAV